MFSGSLSTFKKLISYQNQTSEADSFEIVMSADFLKGIFTFELNDLPSGLKNNLLSKGNKSPCAVPKKSPIGAETAGFFASSQYISILTALLCSLFLPIVPLIHIRWMIPEPFTSIKTFVSPG